MSVLATFPTQLYTFHSLAPVRPVYSSIYSVSVCHELFMQLKELSLGGCWATEGQCQEWRTLWLKIYYSGVKRGCSSDPSPTRPFWKKATFCLSFSPVYWGLENHQQKERERYKYTTMCTHRWLTGCQCARSWLILSSDSFHDTCLRNSEELQFPQELSRVTLIAAMRADTRHPNK